MGDNAATGRFTNLAPVSGDKPPEGRGFGYRPNQPGKNRITTRRRLENNVIPARPGEIMPAVFGGES